MLYVCIFIHKQCIITGLISVIHWLAHIVMWSLATVHVDIAPLVGPVVDAAGRGDADPRFGCN